MKNLKPLLLVPLAALALAGCSGGDGPAPPGNDNAVADSLSKMSKEEKIKFIQDSPLSAEQKAAKLKELGIEDAVAAPNERNPGAPK